jgi:hypothetical protein
MPVFSRALAFLHGGKQQPDYPVSGLAKSDKVLAVTAKHLRKTAYRAV